MTAWELTRGPYPYVSSRDPEAAMVFHPGERSLWVFALEKDGGGVFRYRDGAFELICKRDALGHPTDDFSPVWAFFDAKRGAPFVVLNDWEGTNYGQVQKLREQNQLSTLFVADYANGAFRDRALPPTGEIEYGDELYAARGEMFHIYRPNGSPAELRVLRANGFEKLCDAPEQLAEPGTMGGCGATFDDVLGVHVFVCNDAAMTYDGTTWAEIAVPPGAGHLSDRDMLVTDPTTGRALFIQEPSDGDPATFHRFDGTAWTEVGHGPVTWQAACVDPSRKALVFFLAQRERASVLSPFVIWDGEQLRDDGAPIPDNAMRCGELGHLEISRSSTRWIPRTGAPSGCAKGLWAHAMTPTGPVAFESNGTAWGLRDGTFQQLAAGPAKFKERMRMAGAWDPSRNATLVISGVPSEGNAMLREAFAFDGKQLSPVTWKPPISAVDAGAAYSPALGRLVIAGGKQKWKGQPTPTYELDGDRATQFPAVTIDDPGDAAVLVTDPKTGLVVANAGAAAAVYLGGGTWKPAPAPPANAYYGWFDPTTRTLHARAIEGRIRSDHACAIGDWLDSLPKPAAAVLGATAAASAAPLAAEQNLVLSGANKFWCARLDKKAFTAEWGTRGGKATKKKYPFDTPAKARAAFERETRTKLDEGYAAHPGDPRVLAGKTAHGVKLAAGTAKAADRWGGTPPHFDAKTWPTCGQCDDPMAFVMLLGKHEDRLPLKQHDAVAVFVCNGDGCETYDARDGNHVALLTAAQRKAAGKPPKGARIIKPKQIAYTARFEAAPEEEIERKPLWNKVGGYSDFIQSPQTVACATCGAAMTPVAQFTDDLDKSAKLNFGDRGCGYVVVCPNEHDAAFFWQCY